MTELPDVLTTYTLAEGMTHLGHGCRAFLGAPLPARPLAILGAQVTLETGRFQKMHCNNPGNRKLPADWDGAFCSYACDEIFDASTAAAAKRLGPCAVSEWHTPGKDGGKLFRVVLPKSHPWSRFVAFEMPEEGFADYVSLIAKRFPRAWSCAYAGDPVAFCAALKAGHYFTADLDIYTHGIVSLARTLQPLCEDTSGEISDEFAASVEALVGLTLRESILGGYEYGDRVAA